MKKKGQCLDLKLISGELRKQAQIREGGREGGGKREEPPPACPPAQPQPAPAGEATLGMRRARRLDSSSLVVLRLSSLRLEGEDGRLN